jgi:hypothetical protein
MLRSLVEVYRPIRKTRFLHLQGTVVNASTRKTSSLHGLHLREDLRFYTFPFIRIFFSYVSTAWNKMRLILVFL